MMLDNTQLTTIRKKLALSQEQMARLIGVSFASVNRWEGAHSSPMESALDIYLAINAALNTGNTPQAILHAANNERGQFLYILFRMAYGHTRIKR